MKKTNKAGGLWDRLVTPEVKARFRPVIRQQELRRIPINGAISPITYGQRDMLQSGLAFTTEEWNANAPQAIFAGGGANAVRGGGGAGGSLGTPTTITGAYLGDVTNDLRASWSVYRSSI